MDFEQYAEQAAAAVALPLARPGIAASALFLFFHSWNDYYGPLLYTSENPAWWPVASGSRQRCQARAASGVRCTCSPTA